MDDFERFLLERFPRNHVFNLAEMTDPDDIGILSFIWADMCRALVLGRPSPFSYIHKPTSSQGQRSSDSPAVSLFSNFIE